MKTRRGELRSPAVPQKPLLINILFITGEHSSPLRPRWSEACKQQFICLTTHRGMWYAQDVLPRAKAPPQVVNNNLPHHYFTIL